MPTRAGSTVDHLERAPAAEPWHPGAWLRHLQPATVPTRAPLVVLIHDGPTRTAAVEALGCAVAWLDPSVHRGADLADLTDIADSVRRTRQSVDWLIGNAALAADATDVVLIGHGDGAHLAAMVAIHDPRPAGYVLVSGHYDLSDAAVPQAHEFSPLQRIGASDAECIVAWASADNCSVRSQGQAWAATWSITEWNRPATAIEADGRSHGDVVDDLFDASTALGAAVLGMLSRTRTT